MSLNQQSQSGSEIKIRLRQPEAVDGMPLHALVSRCKPLDENSVYCNLLQCSHFAQTSAAAEMNGELVGFVSGYRVPARPDTLFVWQVAVDAAARGQNLGRRLIREILSRSGNRDMNHVETTITPDNNASWALFRGLARELEAAIAETVLFERQTHFHDRHDDEVLLRIGPFVADEEKTNEDI